MVAIYVGHPLFFSLKNKEPPKHKKLAKTQNNNSIGKIPLKTDDNKKLKQIINKFFSKKHAPTKTPKLLGVKTPKNLAEEKTKKQIMYTQNFKSKNLLILLCMQTFSCLLKVAICFALPSIKFSPFKLQLYFK